MSQKRVLPSIKKLPKHTENRSLSWSLPVPDGAYSQVTAWHSRTKWLASLEAALHSPTGIRARKNTSITTQKILLVAQKESEFANTKTGRGVSTAHQTLANTLGISKSTVRRARFIMLLLGYQKIVVKGRYLTTQERQQAHALHGYRQLRAASIRALTTPRVSSPLQNEHLPRRGLVKPLTHVLVNSPTRASAPEDASRPSKLKKKVRTNREKPKFSVELMKTADELVSRLLFLGNWRTLIHENQGHSPTIRHQGAHLGSVCEVLERSGIDTTRFTGHDLIEIFDEVTKFTGQKTMTGNQVKNPLGYLATLLRRAKGLISQERLLPQHEREAARQAVRARQAEERLAAAREREAAYARARTPEALAAREAFLANRKYVK